MGKTKLNFNIMITFFLIIVIIFSLFYGAVKVPIPEVIKILLNKTGITNFDIMKKVLFQLYIM